MLASMQVSDAIVQIDARLSGILTSLEAKTLYPHLIEPLCYSVLSGGKRIRPLLSIAAGKLNSADFNSALDVGCAVELIHCYSLIHDDLPAMDNAPLRRGQATCHKKYDEATAILVGDALQALAIEVLSTPTLNIPDSNKLKIIYHISGASGINGMVGGQMLDLYSTGQKLALAELRHLHACKTGALIKSAILCGYLCAANFSQDKYTLLAQIADNLGLLFQIVDDILDVTQASVILGKVANQDVVNDKLTYVSLLGLEEARAIAARLHAQVIRDLLHLDNQDMLNQIVSLIYTRNH